MSRSTARVLLIGSVLVGCAGTPEARIVTVPVEEGVGRLALTVGRLGVEDGCLGLALSDGGWSLLIWPSPATEWDAATTTVRLQGAAASIGDRVELAGSVVSVSDDDSAFVTPPTEECFRDSAWLVTGLQPVD
jgi:hypothetical protein